MYMGNVMEEVYGLKIIMYNEQGDYYFGHWKKSLCNGQGVLLVDQKLVYQDDF